MNSHGVEISVAGGVDEMVPVGSYYSFLFFFLLCVHCYYVQEASCSTSYGKNKRYKSSKKQKKP